MCLSTSSDDGVHDHVATFSGHMTLSLLCVQFPSDALSPSNASPNIFPEIIDQLPEDGLLAEGDSRFDISFRLLVGWTIPHSHVLDLFILDLARRIVCVLFLLPQTNTVGLYAVLDWEIAPERGGRVLIDTGIEYVSLVCAASVTCLTFCHSSPAATQSDSDFPFDSSVQ